MCSSLQRRLTPPGSRELGKVLHRRRQAGLHFCSSQDVHRIVAGNLAEPLCFLLCLSHRTTLLVRREQLGMQSIDYSRPTNPALKRSTLAAKPSLVGTMPASFLRKAGGGGCQERKLFIWEVRESLVHLRVWPHGVLALSICQHLEVSWKSGERQLLSERMEDEEGQRVP